MKFRSNAKNGNGSNRIPSSPRSGQESVSPDPGADRPAGPRHRVHPSAPLLVVAVGYALLVALLLRLPEGGQLLDVTVGRPSPRKIVAPRDLEIPDHEGTNALKQQAAAEVPAVFDENGEVSAQISEQVDSYFVAAQDIADRPNLSAEQRRDALAAEISIAGDESGEMLELLLAYSHYGLLRKSLSDNLRQIEQQGIVPTDKEKRLALQYREKGIYVVDARQETALRADVASIRTLPEAREALRRKIEQQFNKPQEDQGPRALAAALGDLLLQANLTLNESIWQQRRQAAMNRIQPLTVLIQQNQKLLDEGDIVPPKLTVISHTGRPVTIDTQILLTALLREDRSVLWSQMVAWVLLLLVPLVLWAIYVRRYHHAVWRNMVKLSSLMGVLVLVVAVGQLLLLLEGALGSDLKNIGYALPVALAGVLITILLDGQLALVSVLTLSIYGGLMFGHFNFFLANLVGGLTAIFSMSGLRRRIDLSWTGLRVALAVGFVASLLYWVQRAEAGQLQSGAHAWVLVMTWSFTHGILTVMLGGFLLPWLEHLTGVVTGIQLLELSQKNDLLQRLEAEAPGTYQHSMNVATLAESAAESIGANGLLARVAALYHDVGKLKKPAYFSENQVRDIEKKAHDKLAPSMSRLLICNHIKDGLEIAEKYNLPTFVLDAIGQHHGTTLLSFFYEKATREDSKDVVSENDYRYPGPRPQSREMAILMLADSLEAASRSLPLGITQGELYQFVRKIINQKFVDNQFEDCDLTLSDLHRLTEAFTRSLVSLLHRRIAYPNVLKSADESQMQALVKTKEESPAPDGSETPVGAGVRDGDNRPT